MVCRYQSAALCRIVVSSIIHFVHLFISLFVGSALHLPDDIVALAEEREPLVQDRLLLLVQIVPVRSAVFGLEG